MGVEEKVGVEVGVLVGLDVAVVVRVQGLQKVGVEVALFVGVLVAVVVAVLVEVFEGVFVAVTWARADPVQDQKHKKRNRTGKVREKDRIKFRSPITIFTLFGPYPSRVVHHLGRIFSTPDIFLPFKSRTTL
jgi:hypothetical protein